MHAQGYFSQMRGFANSGSHERLYIAWLGSLVPDSFAKVRQVS